LLDQKTKDIDMAVSEEARSIVTLMDKILARVIAGFNEHGVELPERRYWTLGLPAADCEQLVVSFNQCYIGPPGDEASEPQRCDAPRTAQIDIQILRCIPGPTGTRGKVPDAATIQKASEKQVIDAWVLLDLACTLDTWDDPSGFVGPGFGVIATVDAGDAQGAFQGPTMHLTTVIP
jgi:hypothetical protein